MGIFFNLLYFILLAFEVILIIRVLMSWLPNIDRSNQFVRIIYQITEPILQPIRNLLPRDIPLDFSPLIVILIISVLMGFLR
jgi:YggT family protein